MAYQLRLFLLAVQFFTRVPITGQLAQWVGFSPLMLRESAAYFPLVGAGVGCAAGTVLIGGLAAFGAEGYGPLIASALSLVATLLITGAFHEDGLADVADGLGGSLDRARALEIMKDSRIGAFGTLALVCSGLLKVAALAEIAQRLTDVAPWALLCLAIAAHTLSRAVALFMIAWLPHVGDASSSKSKPLADQIDSGTLWIAFFITFTTSVLLFIHFDATIFAVIYIQSGVLLWCLGRWFRKRIGGFTGDCLGTVQQVTELGIYLCVVALMV